MKNLNINECLFHGIRNSSYTNSFETLENILIDKYILTHNTLRTKGRVHEREGSCYQGTTAVSICFHPTNQELYKKFLSSGITLTSESPAFEVFVNTQLPSIILDNNLLNELPFRSFGGYKRMSDEIQVLADISLTYMKAIGYSDNIPTLIKRFKLYQSTLSRRDQNSQTKAEEEFYEEVTKKALHEQFEDIAKINYILEQYNYSVPIIDPLTGRIYQDFEQEDKNLRKTLNI